LDDAADRLGFVDLGEADGVSLSEERYRPGQMGAAVADVRTQREIRPTH
jgi:hypothetical protein